MGLLKFWREHYKKMPGGKMFFSFFLRSDFRHFPYRVIQFFISILLLNICFPAQAGDLKKLNIESAFQMALRNNKEIIAAQKIIDKSRLELKVSSRFFQDSPDLTWEVKNREKSNGEDVIDYGGSLNLPVEIRGQRKYRQQKSEINIQIAKLALNNKRLEIKNRLKDLFLNDHILKERRISLEEILDIEEKLIEIMKIRTKHGETPRVELNIIKIEFAKTKEELLQVERSLAANRQDIETVMFHPFDKSTEIEFNLPDYSTIPDIEQIMSYAGKHNYEIMNSRLKKDKTSIEYKLIKSETFIPKVTVAVTYAKDDGDNVTGGAVSIPLPFVSNKKSDVLAAEKKVEIRILKKEKTRQEINSKLKQKYMLVDNLIKRKRKYEKEILPLARQNIEDMEILYKKGEIDFLSFEKIWDQWRKSNNEYLDTLQNYYQTLFSLEISSGGELKEIIMEEKK